MKTLLKKSKSIRKLVSIIRAKKQEKRYLQLCKQADTEGVAGIENLSCQKKDKCFFPGRFSTDSLPKKNLKDIHIFIIDRASPRGPWFQEDLARNFKVTVFSMTRHKVGFSKGKTNLVDFSMGIEVEDRLTNTFWPEDYKSWKYGLQRDILDAVNKTHQKNSIDFCFAYGCNREFQPETLKSIEDMGIPIGLWWLDEKNRFIQSQADLIGSHTVHLTNSIEPMRWYRSRGQACYYFTQAIDPAIYKPHDIHRDIPVSFVGAAYGWRLEFINKLQKAGVPIECFGPGWDNGPVEDIKEIFWRSKINLGIGFTGMSKKLTCIKERDFQVPATNSLYLTTYDQELSRHFEIGKEILCYRNSYDCIDMIRYYLENADEAEAISNAGYQRTMNEHTYTNRMTGLLKWMGILK